MGIDRPLIPFDRAHRCLLGALIVYFLVALGLGTYGYSVPRLKWEIDPAEPVPELLLGKAREQRTDDWAFEGPLMWAQVAHRPPFPLINRNLGFGSHMLVPINVPVRHWLALFKPVTWGFFLGADRGLSWKWNLLSVSVVYVTFLVLMLVSGNQFALSLAGAVVLLYSPFFQFWSLHKAEVWVHGGASLIALAFLLASRRPAKILGWGALLGWFSACYALDFIYPPFQVHLAQLLLLVAPALLLDKWDRSRWRWQLAALGLALAIVAGAGAGFYRESAEAIRLLAATVYPGRRFSTGGDHSAWALFNNNFVGTKLATDWRSLGNLCEAGAFLFFSPLVFAAYAFARRANALIAVLGLFMMATLAYIQFGIPVWLARVTLLSRVPGNRVVLALGIADLLAVVAFLARRPRLSDRQRAGALIVWTGFLLVAAWELIPLLGAPNRWALLAAVGANVGLGYWLLRPDRQWHFLTALLAASVAYTIGFNPVVRGGVAAIERLPIARRMTEIEREQGAPTTWVTFAARTEESRPPITSSLSQLSRILGLRSLDGGHIQPQFSMWREFDPEGKHFPEYNRIGYVTFRSRPGQKSLEVKPGAIFVDIDPVDPLFWKLGVTHFLVNGNDDHDFPAPYFTRVATVRQLTIYRLNYPRPSP